MYTVIEYLERAAELHPDKAAYVNKDEKLTFGELFSLAKAVASAIAAAEEPGNPVAVIATRSFYTPACFLGTAMAGCFYAPIDPAAPAARQRQILDVVKAGTMLVDRDNAEKAREIGFSGNLILMENAVQTAVDEEAISRAMSTITDDSPLYVLFTSGSTGKPKGVLDRKSVV